MNAPTGNILETILVNKWNEVARQKEELPLHRLERAIRLQPRQPLSLSAALLASPTGVIAEFKRRSPSRGWIAPAADVARVTAAYQDAGAAAISCLTDERFFAGGFTDFERARAVVTRVPLLRKDFIVDVYQVYQSRVLGADAILLIAACLTREETRELAALARKLGMETLLEIRDESELDYIAPGVEAVGVNSRDLRDFSTDVNRARELARCLPPGPVPVAESGIDSPATIRDLRAAGFRGFLVGEHLARATDPGQALEDLLAGVVS
ncbi:MAG: indole-3-glycerol phosphate synthase TrpC [Odoribacteraceae bacterium]|jgi:indole-3-glycerol phosphate synthase|nr:indole-3-glycerol phosphate synthase TrpC [Odoribacteraceae bacterium]